MFNLKFRNKQSSNNLQKISLLFRKKEFVSLYILLMEIMLYIPIIIYTEGFGRCGKMYWCMAQ